MNAWKERRAPNGVQRQDDEREEYERDRARVIHSSAFRRLQAKTQILGVSRGRFSSHAPDSFNGSGANWTRSCT